MISRKLERAIKFCEQATRKYNRSCGNATSNRLNHITWHNYKISPTDLTNNSNLRAIKTISTSVSTRLANPVISTPRGEQQVPPRPTDALVRKLLATEDMKRTLERELRKCAGDINNVNYDRLLYRTWNGFTEQTIILHIESGDRLIQLISDTMGENPSFRAFVENTLDVDKESNFRRTLYGYFGYDVLGSRYLPWYMSAVALILAFFNFYLTAIVLFTGAVYIAFCL